MQWQHEKVLVTGGAGFLGKYVVKKLKERGATQIVVPRRQSVDLRQESAVQALMEAERPTVVLHLAGTCAGIAANIAHPSDFFRDNLLMGVHTIHHAWRIGAKKFVQAGTVCSYPALTPPPFRESDLWNGYPDGSNAPYGVAKRVLWSYLDALYRQHGWICAYLLLANLYGPGDHFDLAASHVVPALVRKAVDARREGAKTVEVWGDGTPTREFLFVDDAAEAVVLAAEKMTDPRPVNIGTGESISIRDLVALIFKLAHYEGKAVWKKSKPNGQQERRLNTRQATIHLGFKPAWTLEAGLKETIKYWASPWPIGEPSEDFLF